MFNWLTGTDKDWLTQGNEYRAHGDYAQAIACYDKALANNLNSVVALSQKGRALYDNGDYAQAVTCFNAALKLAPKDAYLHGNKGLCLRALGQYKDALSCCEKAVELDKAHITGWCSLGYIHYCLQQYSKAIECYDKALRIDKRYVAAWNYKANAFFSQGEYEKAWNANSNALAQNANNPYAKQTQALLLLQFGQTQKVELMLEQADKLLVGQDKSAASLAALLTQRGQLYLALRMLLKAKAAFKAALKAMPSYAIARDGLANIKNLITTSSTANALASTSYPTVQTTQLAQLMQQSASPSNTSQGTHSSESGFMLESFKDSDEAIKGVVTEQMEQFSELALSHYSPASSSAKDRQEDIVKEKHKYKTKMLAEDKENKNKLFKEKAKHLNPLLQPQNPETHPLSSSFPTNLLNTSVMSLEESTATCLSEPAVSTSNTSLSSSSSSTSTTSSSMHLPTNYIISNHELTYDKKVGQGAFGEVFKGIWRHEPVAIKRLLMNKLSLDVEAEFKQESHIMARLRSSYIVYLKGIVLDTQPYCIVMDWMPNGSLYEVLHNNKPLAWVDKRRIAADISKGLSFLHTEKIIHRDVKSLNVLLDEHMRAKLSDFGLSKVKVETASKTLYGHEPAKGSLRWMAPELFSIRPKYSVKSDIYAYAIVLWELATSKIPYEEVTSELEIREAVKSGEREELPDSCPADIAKLIRWCWGQKPEKRPDANEIVSYLENSANSLDTSSGNKQKSWQVDASRKPDTTTMTISYQLLEATEEEKRKIVSYYQQYPVPGCDIGYIQVIYSPGVDVKFEVRLKELQKRTGKPAFAPFWEKEGTDEHKVWRAAINKQFEQITEPYIDSDYPNVKLMPAWHGTRKTVVKSILETGYANLATSDDGFFGKGIYSTSEAEYAYRVYSTCNYIKTDGVLLLNWVSSYSAYPAIDSDRIKLKGRGNYANYDAHIVPVAPIKIDDPYAVNYMACQPNQPAQYTEIVVFESAQCLPRYIVELQPNLPKPVPMEREYQKFQKRNSSSFFKPEGISFRDKAQQNKRSPVVVMKYLI